MKATENYLESVHKLFLYYKKLGEGAIQQLSEAQLLDSPAEGSNSIAIIVHHLQGNMLSRWTHFLTEDGEKSWRNREQEFRPELQNRNEIMEAWQQGWSSLFDALQPLKPGQLDQIVYIRNEGHTVLEAINRQLTHYSYHVGQIVFLAKQVCGSHWQSLSIPPGGSAAYNRQKFKRGPERRYFV